MSVINSIKALILILHDGRRGIAQYYDDQLAASCKQFEKKLFAKTKSTKSKEGVLVLDNSLIVHEYSREYHIYVVGHKDENPLVLDMVLNCLVSVIISPELSNQDFWNRMIIAFDEICDSGIVLENDPNLIIQRIVSMHSDDLESIAQRTARRFFGI